jgi:hypothetical protein
MALLRYSPGGGFASVGSAKGGSSMALPVGTIRGNVAIVDAVYGNDNTASVGGLAFRTVNAAISAVSSGQTVYILPGTYTLSSGITIPNGVSIRGMSLQTCTLQMVNVTSATTLVTMGENTRIEDLTLRLTSGGHYALTGVLFGGTTTQTAKLRTCVLTVDNRDANGTDTSKVVGIECNGTDTVVTPTSSSFSFNSLKGSTINVLSNGNGDKRGILISNSNVVTCRDLNVYVAAPRQPALSAGTYIGAETNDSNNVGSIQFRSSTIGVVTPTLGQTYSASDIKQTTPDTISDPTYLASPGIQVGPGTDLVTKSAGGKGFSTYTYPTTIFYGIKGNASSAPSGFLWPGTQTANAGSYPDPGIPAAYYRVQQPAILSGLSVGLNNPPGGTATQTIGVYYTPKQPIATAAARFTGSISGTSLTVVSGSVTGTIAIGQSLYGPSVIINSYIVSGSGLSWTISPSQTIAGSVSFSTRAAASTFTGTITNISSVRTLTIIGTAPTTINVGQYVVGTGVTAGVNITARLTDNTWVVTGSDNVNSQTTMYTSGMLSTGYSLTLGPTETSQEKYDASFRLDTGDRIHVYSSYTGASLAHDTAVQLDMF